MSAQKMLKGHLPDMLDLERPGQAGGLCDGRYPLPRSSEYGTCKTVNARFWPWLSG